jgi:hypothetical protein
MGRVGRAQSAPGPAVVFNGSMSNSGRLRSLLSLNANQCKPNRRLKLRRRPRSPRFECSPFRGACGCPEWQPLKNGGVKTPYETPVARRSFVSTTMPSPRASLFANGQCVSEGNAEVFVSQGRGIFWPIDGKRLDTPYPEAHLYVTGLSGAIDLKEVHQCSGSPSHWEFVMA